MTQAALLHFNSLKPSFFTVALIFERQHVMDDAENKKNSKNEQQEGKMKHAWKHVAMFMFYSVQWIE